MKLALNGPMKLALRIAGGVAALLVVALIGINLLISADAVRDRVAARVKEQTGRELSVKGSTSLMLLPNPHIVITDASINDPSDRSGAADLSIERLELDLSSGRDVEQACRCPACGDDPPAVDGEADRRWRAA